MTLLTLTPTQLPKTGSSAPVNLTSLLAANTLGSNTGVQFSNTGREFLVVSTTSTAGGTTIVVVIGTTIEGQSVTSITLTAPASSTLLLGPFPSDENQPGATMNITFGTPANVEGLALIQNVGVI